MDILEFCNAEKCIKALQVFLYLKSKGDIINEKMIDFKDIKKVIKVCTRRTFNKHIGKLIQLNWIGYNKGSKNYFIRSFKKICLGNNFVKKSGVVFDYSNFSQFKSFVEASIICHDINKQEYACKKAFIKKMGIAALKKGGALQAENRLYLGFAAYSGKSNVGLSKLLHCGKSQANRAKINAKKNRYLNTRKHIRVLEELDGYNRAIKSDFGNSNNIQFRTVKINGKKITQVYQQLHDEIIPMLRFKRIRGI